MMEYKGYKLTYAPIRWNGKLIPRYEARKPGHDTLTAASVTMTQASAMKAIKKHIDNTIVKEVNDEQNT
jgi:hypothetical protein